MLSIKDFKVTNQAFEQGFHLRGRVEQKVIAVSPYYLDVCDGNAYDAILLSQICYWCDFLGKGEKLKIKRKGQLWIVKTYGEWASELHFNSEHTIRNCMKRLAEKELITRSRFKSPLPEHNGQTVMFVRLNTAKLIEYLDQTTYEVGYQPTHEVDPEPTYEVDSIYTENTTENTTDTKDIAPAKTAAAKSPNGASQQSPPIADIEKELDTDYVPNTAHKVLFEYIAEKWHLAKRRKDGIYRSEINGQLGKVDFAHIQRTVSRVKTVFGSKAKPDEIQEYVEYYERQCGSNIRLPQGEAALMRSVLEWRTQKRRFDPNEDPYEALVIRPQDVKGK